MSHISPHSLEMQRLQRIEKDRYQIRTWQRPHFLEEKEEQPEKQVSTIFGSQIAKPSAVFIQRFPILLRKDAADRRSVC